MSAVAVVLGTITTTCGVGLTCLGFTFEIHGSFFWLHGRRNRKLVFCAGNSDG
jgi:hypothetical protein